MTSNISSASASQFGRVSHSKGGLREIDSRLMQRDYVREEHVRSSSIIASNGKDLNRDPDAMPPKHETASFFVCRQTAGEDTGHFELTHAVTNSFFKFEHYVSSEAPPKQCPPELTIATQAAERAITAAASAIAALQQAEQLKESAAGEITQAETLTSAAEKEPADAECLSQTMTLLSEKIGHATKTLCNRDALARDINSQHATAKAGASLARKAAASGERLFQPTLDAAIKRHEIATRAVIKAREAYYSAPNRVILRSARDRTIFAEKQYEKAYEAARARGSTLESIEKLTARASQALAVARGEENAASGAFLAAEREFTAATEALEAARAVSAEFQPIKQRAAEALLETRSARTSAKQILRAQEPLRVQVEIIQQRVQLIQQRVQRVAQEAAQRETAQKAERQVAEEAAKQAITAAVRQAAEEVAARQAAEETARRATEEAARRGNAVIIPGVIISDPAVLAVGSSVIANLLHQETALDTSGLAAVVVAAPIPEARMPETSSADEVARRPLLNALLGYCEATKGGPINPNNCTTEQMAACVALGSLPDPKNDYHDQWVAARTTCYRYQTLGKSVNNSGLRSGINAIAASMKGTIDDFSKKNDLSPKKESDSGLLVTFFRWLFGCCFPQQAP